MRVDEERFIPLTTFGSVLEEVILQALEFASTGKPVAMASEETFKFREDLVAAADTRLRELVKVTPGPLAHLIGINDIAKVQARAQDDYVSRCYAIAYGQAPTQDVLLDLLLRIGKLEGRY